MLSHSKPFLIDKDYLAIQKVLQSGMIVEPSEIPRIGLKAKLLLTLKILLLSFLECLAVQR